MNNIITASILFSFKGKKHAPSIELDLDQHMQAAGHVPDLYPLIAKANGFDLYSYEYEMMQAEPIHFSNPQGMVADYVRGTGLDIEAFESAWHEHRITEQLNMIVSDTMGNSELNQHPELMTALRQAYLLGKNSKI